MSGRIKLSSLTICAVLAALFFCGCNININFTESVSDTEPSSQVTTAAQTEQTTSETTDEIYIPVESTTPNTQQFKNVYDEYAEALVAKTPILISEFYSETEFSAEGNNAEALLENKAEKLDDIFNEGIAGFVIVVGDTNAGDDEFEFWYDKLKQVYDAQLNELISSCAAQTSVEYGEDMDY